jgi:uncharacterized membrane protein
MAREAAGRVPPARSSSRTDAPVDRVAAVDALRGLAIVAMIVYHFAFDLRYFGVTRADFENDPFWLSARAAIVASFLLLAGISAVLADRAGRDHRRFARRIGAIVLCALAVSVASYFVFPQTFIYFGILHCIALSLVVAQAVVRRPALSAGFGLVIVVAGLMFSHRWFDTRVTSWIGFTTVKPPTQDYVPLFPWLGVVLIGAGVGHVLADARFRGLAALDRSPRFLRSMGRHSLAIYMIHQPILLGALWIALRLSR